MNEDGAAAIEFPAAVGLLLLPVAVFVLTIAPVSERRTVASIAAAEAARAYVTASSAEEAVMAAERVVAAIDGNHDFDVALTALEGSLARGSTVSATVEVVLPVVTFPGIGQLGGMRHTAVHREPIDLYRSIPP